MSLWVPPTASRELVDRRMEYQAQLLQLLHFEGGILSEWNRELQKIDPHLRLGQAVEKVPVGFPLVPGYYHLVRLNPGAPPSTTPITGPDDEFAVPTAQMLEKLKRSDLQNAVVMRAHKKAEEEREAARVKREETDREERRESLRERVDAATRTQVLTSDDVPWSQNVAGRRRK